jgi:conjugative transfer region protein TrbK
MNAHGLIRRAAYIVLVVALLATEIALNNRRGSPADSSNAEDSTVSDSSDADLIRCNVLRKEAANSATCKAVWQARRERFLNAKKAYAQQGLIGRVPATPNSNEPTSAGGAQLPASVDRAGPPQ